MAERWIIWPVIVAFLLVASFAALHHEWDLFRSRLHPWFERRHAVLRGYGFVFAVLAAFAGVGVPIWFKYFREVRDFTATVVDAACTQDSINLEILFENRGNRAETVSRVELRFLGGSGPPQRGGPWADPRRGLGPLDVGPVLLEPGSAQHVVTKATFNRQDVTRRLGSNVYYGLGFHYLAEGTRPVTRTAVLGDMQLEGDLDLVRGCRYMGIRLDLDDGVNYTLHQRGVCFDAIHAGGERRTPSMRITDQSPMQRVIPWDEPPGDLPEPLGCNATATHACPPAGESRPCDQRS